MDKYFFQRIKDVSIYKMGLGIILTNDSDKCNDLFDIWEKDERVYAHALRAVYRDKNTVFVVLNFHDPESKMTHGAICHEAIHATTFIFDHIGAIHDPESEEPYNYLCEWIVNNIYEFIKNKDFYSLIE